ncbi:MAG: AAA family ATPase [Candidatus Bathyarchaeota archaeon]
MKILKAEVSNYKSLRKVEIEFGNLTIFIGQNSSGKSNFVEALYLFFNEFDSAPQRATANVPKQLWTGKETVNPIEIAVTFKLTKTEFERLFDKIAITSTDIKLGDKNLKVCREINFKPPNSAFWRTSQVTMNDVPVIFDGEVIKEANIAKEMLTVGGKISSVKPIMPDSLRQEIQQKTLLKLSEMFKQSFKLIPTARNNFGGLPKLGERTSNIPPETEKQLVATCNSEELSDTKVWDKVEKDVDEISSLTRLNTRGNLLRCREGFIRFPLSYTGGGDQELLMISYLVRKGDFNFLAIEEPETHLHPYLARELFSILEDVSKKNQIMITTHSPIFVDLANLKNSWIFRKENRETTVYRIERSEDLRIISYELGIRPSDVFFADKILFVEGRIDRAVYRIWADKLGIDLKIPLISVIPLGGKTEGKRHLQA